jgi:putative membrane protein (TIGR04086 family)
MLKLINYFKVLGKLLIYLLVGIFVITVLNYVNIINTTVFSYSKFIFALIIFFVGGLQIGKKSENNGWLQGIKFGIFLSIILWIFNYLGYDNSMNIKLGIYMLILIVTTMLGSMIGISNKKETK